MFFYSISIICGFIYLFCLSLPVSAQHLNDIQSNGQVISDNHIKYELLEERNDSGWAVYIDNDVMVSGGEIDQDYTGGISVALSGARAKEYFLSIDGLRKEFNNWLGLDNLYNKKAHFNLHSFSYGLVLLTPADISLISPIFDDQPYASYFYIANSNEIVVPGDDIVYQSILSIGFLGLDLAESTQQSIHRLLDSDEPMGWDNQISSGGELTAKYTFAGQKILNRSQGSEFARHEFKLTGEANLGFTTNLSAGFNWRWGRITTPWWSFTPHLTDYINMGVPVVSDSEKTHAPEFFLWFGVNYQVRIYNALMQGQFRNSAVTFDDDELERTVKELSMGITREFSEGVRIGLFIRQRSAALELPNARKPKWGGITISKAF